MADQQTLDSEPSDPGKGSELASDEHPFSLLIDYLKGLAIVQLLANPFNALVQVIVAIVALVIVTYTLSPLVPLLVSPGDDEIFGWVWVFVEYAALLGAGGWATFVSIFRVAEVTPELSGPPRANILITSVATFSAVILSLSLLFLLILILLVANLSGGFPILLLVGTPMLVICRNLIQAQLMKMVGSTLGQGLSSQAERDDLETESVVPAVEETPLFTGAMTWWEIWWLVIVAPSRRTFEHILADPGAGIRRALVWLSSIALGMGIVLILRNEDWNAALSTNLTVALAMAVLSLFLIAGLLIVYHVVLAGVMQFLARLFHGTGSFRTLFYVVSAVAAPFLVVEGAIYVFKDVSPGLYPIVTFGLGVYQWVLTGQAFNVVNGFQRRSLLLIWLIVGIGYSIVFWNV